MMRSSDACDQRGQTHIFVLYSKLSGDKYNHSHVLRRYRGRIIRVMPAKIQYKKTAV
ncbi:hypothetical protein [Psychrobacter sanguinis]|uniref:hypothetical protein n=1 Tax=Psychrobacter sanguinis TaxID=861445 RepID=UPI001E57042A|nr:hypothetical protein [Psychrobacter sanguinis]MCD9152080.1 hypothetical protein [Psychrobacter sanguinis]